MVWLTVCGALCGCKDKTGNEDGESQTMETAVQKLNENFVDTMVLHKVVFNKQIKCNGKLRAVAKSELELVQIFRRCAARHLREKRYGREKR